MTFRSIGHKGLRAMNGAGGFLTRPRKPRYLYLTAFLMPMLIIGVMWAIGGVIPFGSKMILAHDQWHQYYPFYLDLRDRLQEGRSLFHSWTTGMGTNYLSLFAYYLASPLNLPAFLLPESLVMPWYTLMVLVRLGLAGLFCAFFLKKTFGREEFAVVFFSTAYALCAFLMGYYWNAIWLDTVALLPLVTLGTFSLLRDRRYVLYMTSLALSVFCSYYIGLFVCIYVFLLFIGWHVVNWDDMAGFWTRFWRIGLFTLIALGMTALLTIPAYLGLQSTSSAENRFPAANALNIVSIPELGLQDGMSLINRGRIQDLFAFFGKQAPEFSNDSVCYPGWIGTHEALLTLRLGYVGGFLESLRTPLDGIRQIFANAGTLTIPTTMEGLPNIFCGFSTLIFAVLYLFCKRISLRERIFTVLLLLFFANSFLFRVLDYLWHGMHFPNMLPYRFSFLWSFTVIFMAFRAYTQIEHLQRWRAAVLALPVTLLLLCVISGGNRRVILASTAVAIFTMALVLLYSFRVLKKELLTLGLCGILLVESVGCAIMGVRKIGFTDSTQYPTKKEDSAAIVEAMHRREEDTVDLWRAEVAMKQSLNDGTLLGYNGISVFSSAANSRVSSFLQSIGIAASVAGNRYVYQEADPFTNLLLGLKYLIDRNGRNVDSRYFREVDRQGDVLLLENRAYLNLGFLVNDKTLEYEASQHGGLPFDRLNHLFREMTDLDDTLFNAIPLGEVKAVGEAKLSSKTSNGFHVDGKCDDENYVEASFVMPEDGLLCIFSKSYSAQNVIWLLNDEKQYNWTDGYGYNRCMGSFSAGDRITLRYRAKSGQEARITLGAAIFNTAAFDAGYELLSERSMIPTLVSDTRVEGAIRVQEPGLLYLSIPNDEGWTLTVDGVETRITPVGDAMIAVHLEPGLHAIALDFETPGFSLGLKISMVCLAAFLAFLILALLSRFSRPPIVRIPVTLADPRNEREEPAADAPPAAEPLPPRGPVSTMPRLDLTQSWDSGRIPAEADRPGTADPSTDRDTRELLASAELWEQRIAAETAGQPSPNGEVPGRNLLSTTGVFDPNRLTRAEEEGRSPSSFDTLEYLDRLDRLLEDERALPEVSGPAYRVPEPEHTAPIPGVPAPAPEAPAPAPEAPAPAPEAPAPAPETPAPAFETPAPAPEAPAPVPQAPAPEPDPRQPAAETGPENAE